MLATVHYDGTKLRWANRRMHTGHVVIGEVLYEPGGLCGPRYQRDFELVVLHAGDCEVTLDRAEHSLKSGLVYLFRPGHREHFRFASATETHHSYCSITPVFMPADMVKRLDQAPFSVPCSEVFRLLLTAAFKLRAPRHSTTGTLVDQLGLCLFAEFLNASHELESQTSRDWAVRGFLHYVEDHFCEQDCLEAAHRSAGVSRNALIYKFRQEMRITPARYLWKFRIERGAAMLGETGHTIAEIAYRCGFKNPFHFSRLIRQYRGLSPRAIRQEAWSGRQGLPLAAQQRESPAP